MSVLIQPIEDQRSAAEHQESRQLDLTPRARDQLNEALEGMILSASRIEPGNGSDYGVTALADLALFLQQAASISTRSGVDDRARVLADAALELMAEQASHPHWIGGFPGTAWKLRLLHEGWGGADADFTEAVDDVIKALLDAEHWRGPYDLISGVVGFGLYALEHPSESFRHALATRVIDHLDALKTSTSNGVTWHTHPDLLPPHQRQRYPDGYHNLGLGHGIAAIIGFLARCVQESIDPMRSEALLLATLDGFLEHQHKPGQTKEKDPHSVVFGNVAESPDESRALAWCYGDFGICLTLARAGYVLNNQALIQTAKAVADTCIGRRGERSDVVDAGLCHGSAGAALIFHRLWQLFGAGRYAEASGYWLDQTLSFLQPEFEISSGVYTIEGVGASRKLMASLDGLTGMAGVGLTLLTCLHGVEIAWDAPLLSDLHRVRGGSS